VNDLFYENDKDGFIKNPIENDYSNLKKLELFFEEIKKTFKSNLGSSLCSIFVNFIKSKNNYFKVNIIVILNENISRNEKLEKEINIIKDSFSLVKSCRIFSYLKNNINDKELAFNLKVNFICIYGEDFSKQIKNFRPTREDIDFNFQKLVYIMSQIQNTDFNETFVRETSKLLLGVCYELCIDREKKYSQNKYFFYKTFCKYYPDKEVFAHELFKFLNTKNKIDMNLFVKILQKFGRWLILQHYKIILEKHLLNN
jgi:hypothetical protein